MLFKFLRAGVATLFSSPLASGAALALDDPAVEFGEVELTPDTTGARITGARFLPVTTRRRGHVVVLADSTSEEWRHACGVLKKGVRGCTQ